MSDAQKKLNDLLEHVIKPDAERIANIVVAGDVAVVAHKVRDERLLRALGCGPGETLVRKLTASERKRLAASDGVTSRWMQGSRPGRIFVFLEGGTLLVNFRDGEWSLEPGSTDAEAN